MANDIGKLTNRLKLAMHRRIMAEVRLRAADRRATKTQLAAAEKSVSRAVEKAFRQHPVPATATLR
ncbi:MAG: hypothetical protein ABIA67_07170, partial [Candidatus Margulisiibacteriota bacterium]